MSSFITAMNQVSLKGGKTITTMKKLGENHSPEYTTGGVQDLRVALFFALVRDLSDTRLQELFHNTIVLGKSRNDIQVVVDLVVIMFQTRNCRGGKGERDLFYKMFMMLSWEAPQTSLQLLSLVPKYGYYKDFLRLMEGDGQGSERTALTSRVIDLMACQLEKDHKEVNQALVEGRTPKISLLAKYAPRSNHHYSKGNNKESYGQLVTRLFPDSRTPKADYRKMISKLSQSLDLTEVKMCAKKYEEIEFSKVPSLCLKKWTKAFLNEKNDAVPTIAQDDTGNRYPKDQDRVGARANLRKAAMDKDGGACLKGGQLMPHDITREFMHHHHTTKIISTLQREVLFCQWASLRNTVLSTLQQTTPTTTTTKKRVVDLGRVVPLVDVSGSMNGTPMEVAIALGILCSEITHPAFRDRFITFSATPTWVDLSGAASLADKVKTTMEAPWGMNTDFEAAMELILEACIKAQLSQDDIPSLLVMSDMQFDQARTNRGDAWETHYERIQRRFHEAGILACGHPWSAPIVTFWNLRGGTSGFPAQAATSGVRMLSGFNPSLLKAIMEGEEEVVVMVEQDDGTVVTVTTKEKEVITPYTTLRKLLDDEIYDDVRLILSDSKEGLFARYTFVPKPKEDVLVAEVEKGVESMVMVEEGWTDIIH